MESWFFTFGYGQLHENHYVKVFAVNGAEARKVMTKKHGLAWCGQYSAQAWLAERNLCKDYSMLEQLEQRY